MDTKELRGLLERATRGPLVVEHCYSDGGGRYISIRNARYDEAVGEYGASEADAELFAAAVNALPALLDAADELAALKARVDDVQGRLRSAFDYRDSVDGDEAMQTVRELADELAALLPDDAVTNSGKEG